MVFERFQERLLDVLRGADVEHEGCSQHGAHDDVQPAVEAAEAEREGCLPETLRAGASRLMKSLGFGNLI